MLIGAWANHFLVYSLPLLRGFRPIKSIKPLKPNLSLVTAVGHTIHFEHVSERTTSAETILLRNRLWRSGVGIFLRCTQLDVSGYT